jgi:hypothetical protein
MVSYILIRSRQCLQVLKAELRDTIGLAIPSLIELLSDQSLVSFVASALDNLADHGELHTAYHECDITKARSKLNFVMLLELPFRHSLSC